MLSFILCLISLCMVNKGKPHLNEIKLDESKFEEIDNDEEVEIECVKTNINGKDYYWNNQTNDLYDLDEKLIGKIRASRKKCACAYATSGFVESALTGVKATIKVSIVATRLRALPIIRHLYKSIII